MKHLLIFLISMISISNCYSQQLWESEFHSNEEKLYKEILKKNNVKKISTFYHYKKGAAGIPDKVYELDKNGNVLMVIKKASLDLPKDGIIEKNMYDSKGNLTLHVEFNNTETDTLKAVSYQYDSLNNVVLEMTKDGTYKEGKDGKLERVYNNRTYVYENKYNAANLLINQIEKYNGAIILRSELAYDALGNLVEIKRYYQETQCLQSWVQLSYNGDHYLKEKFYPDYECKEGNRSKTTVNSNRYIYKYNAQKQFVTLEHSTSGQARGNMVYSYNPAGLLNYITPDNDFGDYDTSLKYEFYK